MRTVEIYGGPEDGKLLALREDVYELRMAVQTRSIQWETEPLPMPDPGYIQVCLPIKQAHNGRWYAVWKEPLC